MKSHIEVYIITEFFLIILKRCTRTCLMVVTFEVLGNILRTGLYRYEFSYINNNGSGGEELCFIPLCVC